MDTETLAKLLCQDVVHSIGRRDSRNFIVTRFRYPDGEYVLLYISEQNNQVIASDLGATVFKCTVKRILPLDTRNNFIRSVCHRYGMTYDQGELRKTIKIDTASTDCLSFCEAVTRISSIQMDNYAHYLSTMPQQLDNLLARKILPQRSIGRKWFHPTLDPKGDYPVDFRIAGPSESRNIFYVGSPLKSTIVVAVSSFFKLNNTYSPTMTVVDFDVDLGPHYRGRLQRATDRIVYGLKGNEDAIVRFSNALPIS